MEIKTWKPGMSNAEETELRGHAQEFVHAFLSNGKDTNEGEAAELISKLLTLLNEKQHAEQVGYWERNMLALLISDGWYNDDVADPNNEVMPRYYGWRRVLSAFNGKVTFHVPDDFDVGSLPQIERNWDGHTTEEKWKFVSSITHQFKGVVAPEWATHFVESYFLEEWFDSKSAYRPVEIRRAKFIPPFKGPETSPIPKDGQG